MVRIWGSVFCSRLSRSILQHVINQSNPNEPTKAIGKQTKKLEQQKPQQYNDNHHDISARRIRSEDRARRSGARNRRRQGPWPGKCIVAPDISFELTSSIIGPPIRIVAFQSALLFAKFSMSTLIRFNSTASDGQHWRRCPTRYELFVLSGYT